MPSPAAQSSPPEALPAHRHLILGTAGHIDHGKTTLVRALTGTDTDRLPEEKRRGMTIELGFARLCLDGVTLGVVDVPGHERFVKTMVAGATGIDLALIVVAADDSVMPQTVEHVEILDLLGVTRAAVAITKCDLVESDMIELVEAEVHDLLASTGMADAPVVRVSSATGAGLDELRSRLVCAAAAAGEDQADTQRLPRERLPFRMPIDRVFTVAGRGTVVTGSVISGCIHAGDTVDILPADLRSKVRELQSHGTDADSLAAGQRGALNLQGVGRDQVERGFELAAPGVFEPTRLVDVHLHCLASHNRPIKTNARLRLCVGAREVLARCVLLSDTLLSPGSHALAQLRCREPVTVAYGQRFILRDENAARTVGGGIVLRAAQRRISHRQVEEAEGLTRLRDGSPDQRVAEVLRSARFTTIPDDQIALSAGVPAEQISDMTATLKTDGRLVPVGDTSRFVSADYLSYFDSRFLDRLRAYHQIHPDEPGCLLETVLGWIERRSDRTLARPILARLTASGAVRVMGRYACLKEFAPALSRQDEELLSRVLAAFEKAAFQPPDLAALAAQTGTNTARVAKLVKVACSLGELVQVDASVYLHGNRERELRDMARKLFAAGGPFTVAQLREALASSRKFAVPMAEHLDRVGFTHREGDVRVVIERDPT